MLDGFEVLPRAEVIDDFGLEEAVNRFRERVVVRVSDASDGRLDASFGESLGVANREILHASVAMMHESRVRRPSPDGLLKSIEREVAFE
jgi:hypothetical protein